MRALPTLLALAVLAGCGGGDEAEPAASTPLPSETATATATATATGSPSAQPTEFADPLEGAGTEPVSAEPANTETALLSDVRVARQEGYDRLVFEFRDELPGYEVAYVEEAVADGSGDTVDVNGEAVLQIRMQNALDADLSQPDAPRTYTGPDRLTPDTPVIAEVARTGGFEGVLTWVAGLRDRVDFKVTALESPPRLVVDVRNH